MKKLSSSVSKERCGDWEQCIETRLLDIRVMREGLKNVLFVSLGKEHSVAFGGTREDFWSCLLLHVSLVPQIISFVQATF